MLKTMLLISGADIQTHNLWNSLNNHLTITAYFGKN